MTARLRAVPPAVCGLPNPRDAQRTCRRRCSIGHYHGGLCSDGATQWARRVEPKTKALLDLLEAERAPAPPPVRRVQGVQAKPVRAYAHSFEWCDGRAGCVVGADGACAVCGRAMEEA